MARITAAFRVEEATGKIREGRQCVRLLEPLVYHVGSDDSSEVITVPAGFETDWASVPWFADGLIPAFGPHARPAILHDYLYATRGLNGWYSRKRCDEIFLEALEVVGVPWLKRSAMFRAVRLGGGKGFGS
jgi:hypothetical protein